MAEQYNLLFHQGTDFKRTIRVRGGAVIRCNETAAGATAITLRSPLREGLSGGEKVDFDGVIVTLSGDAAVGDRSLLVNQLTTPVQRVDGQKVTNLTGYSVVAEMRLNGQSAVLLTTAITDADEGLLTVTLTDAQTTSLAQNIPTGLFLADAEVQAWKYTGSEYLWGISLTDTSGNTERLYEGVALVGFRTVDGTGEPPSGGPNTGVFTLDWGNVSGKPDNVDQLAALTASDGSVVGWSNGALANVAPGGTGAGIASVFGRTGPAIVAQTGDYTPAQVGAQPVSILLTALTALTPENGKAIGWIGGAPANLSLNFESAGAAASAIAAHEAAADPHPVYALESALGTAAGFDFSDFATAVQGAKADTAVQPAAIADFEASAQLNLRDTANRDRANHTGTQSVSTVAGLGTAATQNTGTGANNIVQLDSNGRLPAVDGSQLTGILTGSGDQERKWRELATTYNSTPADVTGAIPVDNTAPQSTEGSQVMTVPVEPTSASSKLVIEVQIWATELANTGGAVTAAVFRDSETDPINGGVGIVVPADASAFRSQGCIKFHSNEIDSLATTLTTFAVRIGNTAGSAGFNKVDGAPRFNGKLVSFIRVWEVQ